MFRVKSKKPGGELHYLPITRSVAAILLRERDHHPVRVFTYVCARNRYDPRTKTLQRKGSAIPSHMMAGVGNGAAPSRKPRSRISDTMICGTAPAPVPCARIAT